MSYAVKMFVANMSMVEIPDRVPVIPVSAFVCKHLPPTRTAHLSAYQVLYVTSEHFTLFGKKPVKTVLPVRRISTYRTAEPLI